MICPACEGNKKLIGNGNMGKVKCYYCDGEGTINGSNEGVIINNAKVVVKRRGRPPLSQKDQIINR